MKKILAAFLITTLLATLLIACKGNDTSSSGNTATEGSKEDITQVKTEFRFITAMSDAPRTGVLDTVIEKLKEKYPNVEFVNDSGEDYNSKAKLAFSSGEGYAMVLTDDLGLAALYQADYLMDITEEIKARGWEDAQLSGATNFYNQRSAAAYTVGMNYAPVIVYYNKDIFDELNLDIPTTLDEYETVLKTATEQGYIGAENCKDNINGWYIQSIVQNKAPFDDILKWYYREESGDSMKDAFIQATEIVKKWSDAGYFRKDYIGIDYGDVPSLFAQGKTAMSLDGNWFLSEYESTGINVGIFAFPGVTSKGDENYIINPVDAAFAIGAHVNETQKAVALDFIDAMMQPETADQWLAVGSIPSLKYDYSNSDISDLTKELLAAISDTQSGFYLDNVKPGFLEGYIKEMQLALTGDQTMEQMWENIDKEWNED